MSHSEQPTEIPVRFREERIRLDLDQTQVARICGVDRKTVYRWETTISIPAEKLASVVDAGFDPVYVLTGRRPGDPWPEQLRPEEKTLIDQYRSLSKDFQSKLSGYLDSLYELSIRKGQNKTARKKSGHFLKVAEEKGDYPAKKTKAKTKKKKAR